MEWNLFVNDIIKIECNIVYYMIHGISLMLVVICVATARERIRFPFQYNKGLKDVFGKMRLGAKKL